MKKQAQNQALLVDDNPFEERADYIDTADLQDWNVENEFFRRIQKDLLGRGARLLVGPRGCGKTHQIKLAHAKCLDQSRAPFSVYVSFTRYLYLEPRLGRSSLAIRIFHTWVLCKIIIGTYKTCIVLESPAEPPVSIDELRRFVAEIEKGLEEPWHDEILRSVTVPVVLVYIEDAMRACARKRAILLLDDAALTLTPEYMVEFFEVFRSMKTKTISPKASVYPGTTEYGPRFHVGHDAQPVNCWLSIEDAGYSQFMEELLETRLDHAVSDTIASALCCASIWKAWSKERHRLGTR